MDKKKKIIKGGAFLAVVKILQQVVSFSVNSVLAVILDPSVFGIVALVTVFNGFIAIFTNFGFGASVIQRRRVTKLQLSSLFWLDFATSVVTFLIIFFAAPIIADIYSNAEIVPLLRLISINFLIVSFFSLNRKLLEKKLEFTFLAISDISATVISSVAGIIMAFAGFKAYSLVFQYLIVSISYVFLIRIKNNWFAKFVFDWKSIKELVIFTLKYKGALTINYFERNIDFLILGKLYPVNIVGLYSFAYNIMYLPVKRISNAFGDVLFPSFSSVNEDYMKLRSYFLRVISTVAIITFPLTVLIFFNADFIIHLVFGEKWHDAIAIVRILCFAGALLSIDFSLSILPAIDKTELSIYFGILRIVLLVAGIIIGSFFGIKGVAYGILTVKALSALLNLFVINSKIKLRISEFVKAFRGPIISSLLICIIAFFLSQIKIGKIESLLLFGLQGILSLVIIFFINKGEVMFFYNQFKSRTD